ncbi:MAG: DUF5131 family protein [Thermoproteales archaeon]|nr:DUF5131 family protein [Thermoproteales archaeon]
MKNLIIIKNLLENILNSGTNGRKMFSIVTKTWNPVAGCLHYCKYCWARKLAVTKLKNSKRYRDGFRPRLNEEEFREKFEKGDFVFVSDMGDLFGDFMPSKWIEKVIKYIRRFPETHFLFLTKNPERYFEFLDIMPENAILGATIETNKDELYLEHVISRAPLPSRRYEAMKRLDWNKKFISIEPVLDFNLEIFVDWLKDIAPFLIYIGYDNYNNKLPEPPLEKTLKLIALLSEKTLVVKKL